ncbi:hypothetical protein AB835_14710 [Candidatus Endobugula sertula]|uniref:Uncharacterized protein n=1 Tax=Candidatus Endobugula sertula TaxID=62101 RepID=A0A1D2QL97_9GAMM|nr:hypothetical protein AB835_14710 [Candidatus Endobugula sertula]
MQELAIDKCLVLTSEGKLEALKELLAAGECSVNDQDSNGYSLLMASSSYGNVEILKFLLNFKDVDVNLVDADGESALHYCRDVECMKLLIEAGGNLALKNANDETPLVALDRELKEEVDLLVEDENPEHSKLSELVLFLQSDQVCSKN